jgi:tetratricopeptide (TPR) repeat protein
MKRRFVFLPISILFALAAGSVGLTQRGGGHVLFGDFKVDERRVGGLKPQVFQISLCRLAGNPIYHQTVSNNGRYRFLDVLNGEYDLVVEMEGQEVARIHILLNELIKTDIRRDIYLEWKPDFPARDQNKVQVLSVTDLYQRGAGNSSRFLTAQERMNKKDYVEAVKLLDQIVTIDPKDFEAWTELGTAHFQLGQMTDAEKGYLRALQERSSFFPAVLNMGKLNLVQKKYDDAVEVLTRAVQLHPDSADANFFLGEACLQIKKGSKAVSFLNEAIRLDPVGKAEAHLRLAALYNAAGMKQKAAAEYQLFLEKRPDYPGKQKLERYIAENKK